MTNRNQTGRAGRVVRYDGSPDQSDALRAIAMDAFHLDTYSDPGAIRDRLDLNCHRVWLISAEKDLPAAGFLATFPTDSLAGRRVEFDLLAVRSDVQGKGLAGRLMQSALAEWRSSGATPARALIRQENGASTRVFQRAGFAPAEWKGELLIGQAVAGEVSLTQDSLTVRLVDERDLSDLRQNWPSIFLEDRIVGWDSIPPKESEHIASFPQKRKSSIAGDSLSSPPLSLLQRDDFGLLVATDSSGILGFAELLVVHTIPYSGVWVEHLEAIDDDPDVMLVLTEAARRWAAGRGLGQAGAVIDLAREAVRSRLRDAGYHSAGVYRHFHRPAMDGELS